MQQMGPTLWCNIIFLPEPFPPPSLIPQLSVFVFKPQPSPPSTPQVLELLADHLRQWATSIAFPELSHLTLLALRRFAKVSFKGQAPCQGCLTSFVV